MAETSIFKNPNQLQHNISHSTRPPLSMHSQLISKPKPKIRIIHIFAPEIIKTDVENFRELVQRLTGKPAHDFQQKKKSSNKMKKQRAARKDQEKPSCNFTSVHGNQLQEEKEMARSGRSSGFHGVKEEEKEEASRKNQENPKKSNDNFWSFHENQLQEEMKMARSTGCPSGFPGVKEEEEGEEEEDEGVMWSNNGGYLNGIPDFEGFMHEFGEFPLMPLHAFEEPQFA